MAPFRPTRRSFLLSAGALVGAAAAPRLASAAVGRDPRFLFVFLRGGLDGLATVAPVGDPAHEAARGGLEISGAGSPLDSFFTLNPNMRYFAAAYARHEASVVHAVASPYRERSHFDGQDVVESGLGGVGPSTSGWMNRMIGLLGASGRGTAERGLSVGPGVPLAMRGPAPVVTWIPAGFPAAKESVRSRLLDLYTHVDPTLARRFEAALELDRHAGAEVAAAMPTDRARPGGDLRRAAIAAGNLMAREDGPHIATVSFVGWDTHANERPLQGALGHRLAALDDALEGLSVAMAPVWKDTVIVVATEFGRTVRMNGTSGTDHGTASVALLLGGAVSGGRVVADWPGLAEGRLHENRDLAPTTDLRAVFKAVGRDHLGLDPRDLANVVFPDSVAVAPLGNLIV